jgi:hypothetical protein
VEQQQQLLSTREIKLLSTIKGKKNKKERKFWDHTYQQQEQQRQQQK